MRDSTIVKDGKSSIIVEKDGVKFNLDDKWYVDQYKYGPSCRVCGDRGAQIAMLHQNCFVPSELSDSEKRRKEWDSKHHTIGKRVYARDGFICCSCGNTNVDQLNIDHITPISKGGSNELSNLRVMCKSCNSKKGAR